VLLERPGEAGGNFVDAHGQLGGHAVDRTGDLGHEHLLGGQIPDRLDVGLGEKLAFEKATLRFRLLRILLEGLHGLHRTTHIPFDENEGIGAGEQGFEFRPGAVAIDGPAHQGVFGYLADTVAGLETGPKILHLLDRQALEIKDQRQFSLTEEPFELFDDLLLVLQRAAHGMRTDRGEQAGYAAPRWWLPPLGSSTTHPRRCSAVAVQLQCSCSGFDEDDRGRWPVPLRSGDEPHRLRIQFTGLP
jgi:hypothetical protein